MEVKNRDFIVYKTVVYPHIFCSSNISLFISVPLGRIRDFCQIFGASQTDHPSWSGCRQTLDIASTVVSSITVINIMITHVKMRETSYQLMSVLKEEYTCSQK